MKKKKNAIKLNGKFLIIALFWIVVIGIIIAVNESILDGEEVYLETEPIDPRDLFRGDYMILSYDISTLSADDASMPDGIGIDDTIYLRLSVDQEGFGRPIAILEREPTEGLFIKGKIVRVPTPVSLEIEYGIESYFIPEGTGADMPRITEVLVAIDDNGRARIKEIYNEMNKIE